MQSNMSHDMRDTICDVILFDGEFAGYIVRNSSPFPNAVNSRLLNRVGDGNFGIG